MRAVKTIWRTLQKQGLLVRSFVLMIFEIFFFVGITPFLWIFGSVWSFAAAGTAAGLCTIGALLAIWIHYLCEEKSALMGLMLSMGVNMGVPLVFGLLIHLYVGPLSESRFIYYLVYFYLLTLAIKTMLTLPLPRHNDG
jgi:hypothetical protein